MDFSLERLRQPLADMKYLLYRGYPKSIALDIVARKYPLSKPERSLLLRSLHTEDEIRMVKFKLAKDSSCIKDEVLSVDGFNVLITLESLIRGDPLLLCDDGIIRDIYTSFRKYKITDITFKALGLLFRIISSLRPRQVFVVYDAPISHSGKLAMRTREVMKSLNIQGDVMLSKKPNTTVATLGILVASSDIVVISKAKRIVDLARMAIPYFPSAYVINVRELYAPVLKDVLKKLI